MTAPLLLRVRTPSSLIIEAPVRSIRAEDRQGWFGILPGRAEIVSVLPVGLILYQDDAGEGYIAIGGGLLHGTGFECRVMVREALTSRDLDTLGAELERYAARRRERREREREVIDELTREALLRMAEGARRS